MSNVDMMMELADAREAGRSYDANLTTFRQAGEMYRGLLSLLGR
jgi:flagellar basal-body rod protein FlgC